jgi:hypothetical protein
MPNWSLTPASAKRLGARVLAVALGSAAVILVAPLIILTVLASWADRKLHRHSQTDQPTWLATFLYKSSLAELPLLLGELSGWASPSADVARVANATATTERSPRSVVLGHDLAPLRKTVTTSRSLQDLGCNLRTAFIVSATGEFDGLVGAIDGANGQLAGELEGIPTAPVLNRSLTR